MKKLMQFLLYRSLIAPWLYNVVYYRWQKRFKAQKGFLSGVKLHHYLPENKIFKYHAAEEIAFQRPRYSEKQVLPNQIDFYVGKRFTVSDGEVYEFDRAYLIGENAVGVTYDGQIILDTAMDLPNVLHKCSPRLLMNYNRLKTEVHYDCVLSLVNIFSNNHYVNYFHWLTDCMLLLEGWYFYQATLNIRPQILINQNPTAFQKELLMLVGVEEGDLIFWKDYKRAEINHLIVVKSRRTGTNMDEIVSPHGANWLRNEVNKRIKNRPPRFRERVFLSRQNASARRILNYEELVPILDNYDFEVVETDTMTVADQIQLFSNTRLLFAVHGAGLTNIIFSEKVTILELVGNLDAPDDFQWYCAYYSLSQALRHDYSFLECEHVPVFDEKKVRQFYNVRVDVDQVDYRLQQLTHGI